MLLEKKLLLDDLVLRYSGIKVGTAICQITKDKNEANINKRLDLAIMKVMKNT